MEALQFASRIPAYLVLRGLNGLTPRTTGKRLPVGGYKARETQTTYSQQHFVLLIRMFKIFPTRVAQPMQPMETFACVSHTESTRLVPSNAGPSYTVMGCGYQGVYERPDIHTCVTLEAFMSTCFWVLRRSVYTILYRVTLSNR